MKNEETQYEMSFEEFKGYIPFRASRDTMFSYAKFSQDQPPLDRRPRSIVKMIPVPKGLTGRYSLHHSLGMCAD
jgi:hypothetical protein